MMFLQTLSLHLCCFRTFFRRCYGLIDVLRLCDRWWILGVAAIVLMICFGPVLSFGAVIVTTMNTFQTDRAEAATVQSVFIGVTISFGLISGVLVTKFGPTRVILLASVLVPLGYCIAYVARNVLYLCFTIGLLSGVGNSMVLVSSIIVVERVFDDSQRFLSLSILNTSTVMTAIFYPYFLRWLTEAYGLNGMFLILGGLSCNIFIVFTVFCTSPTVGQNFQKRFRETNNLETGCDQGNKYTETSCVKRLMSVCVLNTKELFTKPFVCVLLATGLSLGSLDGYLGLMLDIALWKGMSNSQGLASFVVYYSFTTGSCIFAGILTQRKGVNVFLYPILSALCGCIGLLLIYCIAQYITYMVGTSLIGIAFGGIISSSVNAAVQIVRAEQVPLAAGFLHTLEGIVSVGVGPLYGSIRDWTGSYTIVLLANLCIQAVCTVLFILALICYRREKKEKRERKTVILATTKF